MEKVLEAFYILKDTASGLQAYLPSEISSACNTINQALLKAQELEKKNAEYKRDLAAKDSIIIKLLNNKPLQDEDIRISRDIMKSYHLGFKPQEIEKKIDGTILQATIKIAFDSIAESFAKKKDDEILGFLYDKYKDTDVSDVYVLSEEDFRSFLLQMLPIWRNR